eukprot:4475128-Amphidinium_carterae.1
MAPPTTVKAEEPRSTSEAAAANERTESQIYSWHAKRSKVNYKVYARNEREEMTVVAICGARVQTNLVDGSLPKCCRCRRCYPTMP